MSKYLHLESISQVHAFLDDDIAGQRAFEAAVAKGLLESSCIKFSKVGGKREAELEYLYNVFVYSDIILTETDLDWIEHGQDFSKKWTDRLRNLLKRAGKPDSDAFVNPIKLKVTHSEPV